MDIERNAAQLAELFASDTSRLYYHYRGSSAGPTHEEVVDLFILSEPQAASAAQVAEVDADGFEEDITSRVVQGVELVE